MPTHASAVHLHVHSAFSDGTSSPNNLARRAAELGYRAMALTDHNTLRGAALFKDACAEVGLKPIFGVEISVLPRGYSASAPDTDTKVKRHHLTLLAETQTGYLNLIKLVNAAQAFNPTSPAIDFDLLRAHAAGVICLSGCRHGEIPTLILSRAFDRLDKALSWYIDTFGDRFYLECALNEKEDRLITEALVEVARMYAINLVASADVHYADKEDHDLHTALSHLRYGGVPYPLGKSPTYQLLPPDQFASAFADYPSAIANTLAIAERCEEVNPLGGLLRASAAYRDKSDEHQARLVDAARFAWARRTGHPAPNVGRLIPDDVKAFLSSLPPIPEETRERLGEQVKRELELTQKLHFAHYFDQALSLAADLDKNGIFFHVRGSANSSALCYVLGITEVNPVQHGLLSERFLNEARKAPPDIDFDIPADRQPEVVRLLQARYGADRVGALLNYQPIAPASAWSKAYNHIMGHIHVNEKLDQMFHTIRQAIAQKAPPQKVSALLREVAKHPHGAQVVRLYKTLVENEVAPLQHPSGFVISPHPLSEVAPLATTSNADWAYIDMPYGHVESSGLVKLDLLRSETIQQIQSACAGMAQAIRSFRDIPFDAPQVVESLLRNDVAGIYMLGAESSRAITARIPPASLEDVANIIALNRPGTLSHAERYIANRLDSSNPPKWAASVPEKLRNILSPTYGVLLYQEQVMQALSVIAGLSLAETDQARAAISKKRPEMLKPYQAAWMAGCAACGIERREAAMWWDAIVQFGGYGMNKAHALAAAMMALREIWVRESSKRDFYLSRLNAQPINEELIGLIQAQGVPLYLPDINESQKEAKPHNGGMMLGMTAVPGLSDQQIDFLIREREKNGAFRSIQDLLYRLPRHMFGANDLRAMLIAGALDALGEREAIYKEIARRFPPERPSNWNKEDLGALPPIPDDDIPLPLLLGRDESLRFLSKDRTGLSDFKSISTGKIGEITLTVTSLRVIRTRTGERMCFFTAVLADKDVNAVVFPSGFKGFAAAVQKGLTMTVVGRWDERGARLVVEFPKKEGDRPPASMLISRSAVLPRMHELGHGRAM